MSTTIDSLQLEIGANAQNAESGLNHLIATLDKLKSATASGGGLRAVCNKISALANSCNGLSGSGLANLNSMVNTLNGLRGLQGITVSSTIAKNLRSIGEATNVLTPAGIANTRELSSALVTLDSAKEVRISPNIGRQLAEIANGSNQLRPESMSNIRALSSAVSTLSAVKEVRISSTIGRELINIGIAAEQIQGIDFSVFERLATMMQPLAGVERASGLSNTLNQLRRIPDMVQQLDTATLDTFAMRVRSITDALTPLVEMLDRTSNGLRTLTPNLNSATQAAQRMTSASRSTAGGYTDMYSMLRMTSAGMRGVSRTIAKAMEKSNSYVEDVNLFTASLGKYSGQAQSFAERVGDLMGIDPGKWMRNQGVFMTLTEGFGVASDRAYIMSKNLTQLGYDLSSFFNLDITDSMTKLQSGISGELEPLRRLGFDLSQARLEAEAAALGISKSFKDMTQAEKSQLRYQAIMTQVTTAQGDMARTLDAPANQMRVLSAAVEQAARALGNIFIPALNAVLPAAIALANVVQTVAAAIASLFGFAMPSIDYSGVEGASSAVQDLDKSLGGAGGSAKKLNELLADFDELNVIQTEGSGGGGGGGSAIDPSKWDFDLSQYDFLGNLITSKAQKMYEKLKPILEWITDHIEGLVSLAEAFGFSVGAWKIATSIFPDLKNVWKGMDIIRALALDMAVITITAMLVYDFDSKFLKSGDFLNLIADGLTTAAGSAIAGAVTARAFGSGAAGQYVAAVTLTISALTSIKAIFDSVVDDGISWNTLTTGVVAAIKGAAAGGLIAKVLGYGVAAGALIGFEVTAAITIAIASIAMVEHAYQATLASNATWGDVKLTAEEMQKTAEKLFTFSVSPTISLMQTTLENEDALRKDLETMAAQFNTDLTVLKLGVDDEATRKGILQTLTGGATDGSYTESSLIGQMVRTLESVKATAKLGVTLLPPTSESGEALDPAKMLENVGISNDVISGAVTQLGTDMARLLAQSMEGELDAQQSSLILKLGSWVNEINQAVLRGETNATHQGKTELLLSDLDRESLTGVLQQYAELEGELRKNYEELAVRTKSSLGSLASGAEATYNAYNDLYGALEPRTISAKQAWENALADYLAYDPTQTVERGMEESVAPARAKVLEALQSVFDIKDTWFAQNLLGDVSSSAIHFLEGDATDAAEQLKKCIDSAFESTFGKENKAALDYAESVLGIEKIDLLPEELKQKLREALESIVGKNMANEVFKQIGGDTGACVGEGMSSNSDAISTEANSMATNAISSFTRQDWYGAGANAAAAMTRGFASVPMPTIGISGIEGAIRRTRPVSMMASGGFPSTGELFVAREAGAEMVGRIGRKTAVANNEQIVDGVASGVASGQSEQTALLRQQNALLQQLLRKEFKAEVAPSVGLGRVNARSQQLYEKAYGV